MPCAAAREGYSILTGQAVAGPGHLTPKAPTGQPGFYLKNLRFLVENRSGRGFATTIRSSPFLADSAGTSARSAWGRYERSLSGSASTSNRPEKAWQVLACCNACTTSG